MCKILEQESKENIENVLKYYKYYICNINIKKEKIMNK